MSLFASKSQSAALERALVAADRQEIAELGARFDNGLDAENQDKFVGTFVAEGVLAGFWGEAKGPEQIAGAFNFMLSTFARNRRHFVGNHEITVESDTARMFSYMPLIFTFMLGTMPAGLVIYWAWNNLLTIGQQSLIMHRQGVKVELLDNIRDSFKGLVEGLRKLAGLAGGALQRKPPAGE